MAVDHRTPKTAGLRTVEARPPMRRSAEAMRAASRLPSPAGGGVKGEGGGPGSLPSPYRPPRRSRFGGAPRWHIAGAVKSRWVRRLASGVAAVVAIFVLVAGGLWFTLANGPISLDVVTPWLAAAIAENFGSQFRVDIGGTVLERDEHGRTAMRIRSITVRDQDGTVVANAPKAEVGFSAASLLSGRPRAERLNLVGAELAVHIETDGKVTVSTGAGQRPLAIGPALSAGVARPSAAEASSSPRPQAGESRSISPPSLAGDGREGAEVTRSPQESFAAFLAWVDSLSAFGLDGGDLTEVGLKSGNLVVDDRRNGQQSRFENIRLSLTRPHAGALEFQLGSEDAARPWLLVASVKPGGDGARMVDLEARKVLLKDLLLALRVDGGQIETNGAVSAMLRAELAQDGTPQFASGRILVGPGSFIDVGDRNAMITIDRAEMQLDWNATKRALALPFQIVSGATRMTLMAQAAAPGEPNGSWALNLSGGSIVLAPTSPSEEPLVLNRILVRSRIDPVAQRLNLDQVEVAGKGISVAMSGNLDYSSPDPRLKLGMAARKLPLAAFKQMWPPLVTPAVRT